MHAHSSNAGPYLTLTDVAKHAPGRPSTNCVWRWCRRGVKSRSGDRVRLRHVRMGGMIFTTKAWLDEFGQKLADADARYFDLAEAASTAQSGRRQRGRGSPSSFSEKRESEVRDAETALTRAGI